MPRVKGTQRSDQFSELILFCEEKNGKTSRHQPVEKV